MYLTTSRNRDRSCVARAFRGMCSRYGCLVARAFAMVSVCSASGFSAEPAAPSPRSWPQGYSVSRDDAAGRLTLSTRYYTVEQDLSRGGAVTRIALMHGRAENLLIEPLAMRVCTQDGTIVTDVQDATPVVTHRREGLQEIVTVESTLKDGTGQASAFRVRTTLQYRWGYLKLRRELLAPAGSRVREVCPLATVLAGSLTHYGYRPGVTEQEGDPPFSFHSNLWGKLRLDQPADRPLETPFVPRSMIFVDPGVEGLEWFVTSDLSQWERQLTGRRGDGRVVLARRQDPAGLSLAISTYCSADKAVELPERSVFDCYLAVPLKEASAQRPWLHTSFNRNRGNWVSSEDVARWAEKGVQTVHCHNDGDYYGDGLFWRDGAYPPYPDMDRFDRVLTDCRRAGIRTATYFSNKELHPSTTEFQQHGEEWGRKDRAGNLQHNFYQPEREFGAQMCLRSGWLDFLKFSIDRVLTQHPLDGVYYDWNVALLCSNPLHEGKGGGEAVGHWDMDELLELMEWTRQRVGMHGLVIVHNTTVPMFALENFADYVVATEWGYQRWTDLAPDLEELPLEMSLAGAIPRGAISYGVLDAGAPRRLHQLFAVESFLNGVAPWPASEETFALNSLLKPLGNLSDYAFVDWRNRAVTLSDLRCGAAVYSRPGETYLLLANLEGAAREVTCTLHPELLPFPLTKPSAATCIGSNTTAGTRLAPSEPAPLAVQDLLGRGAQVTLPGDGVLLLRVR